MNDTDLLYDADLPIAELLQKLFQLNVTMVTFDSTTMQKIDALSARERYLAARLYAAEYLIKELEKESTEVMLILDCEDEDSARTNILAAIN